ncbi:MAG: hypothetical protein IPP52_18305 [Ignavibacteria bacterium]|nr:hypothetical protein [Ignavibacteria bacterium]
MLVFLTNVNFSYSQFDSSKIKAGPEELNMAKGGNYFNFADKNKINIEVTIIGGAGSGRYLIPEGTSVFDLLLMSGGTGRKNVDDIKLLRFASETPQLKPNEIIQLKYENLYSEEKSDILKSNLNPLLKPGDMIIVPEVKPDQQSFWYYAREVISYVGTFVSFYYLIYNIFRDNNR